MEELSERMRLPTGVFAELRQRHDIRSAERIATEKRYLKRKWKAHIKFENYQSQDRVAMDVPRRQSVALN